MGWKSKVVLIVEMETCHENKKLRLQSEPAAVLGRGLRSHKNPGRTQAGRGRGALIHPPRSLLGLLQFSTTFLVPGGGPTGVGTCHREGAGITLCPQPGPLSLSSLPA